MMRKITPAIGMVASMAMLFACQDLKPIKGKGRVRVGGSTGSSTITDNGGNSGTSGPKVKVEMYVMSKCPFGVRAEDGFKPVLDAIGDRIDYHVDFIVNEKNGEFKALHGKPEVDGNIIQLCAMKHYPSVMKWSKFLACQNRTWRNIPNNWEGCAKETGLDVGKMKSCYEGSEGKDLLRASMKRAQARRAQGSPTIYVAGKPYSGGRGKNDFLRAICQAMSGDKPSACKNIPEPVEVAVTILTDKRCKKCFTAGLQSNLRGRFFPKLTVKEIDYGTDEGKKLYKELGLKYLPAWLFHPGVEKAEKYARISRWMIPKGKFKQLRVPARFDPTAEICDNKKDDTGNGKVDCDDPTCKGKLECREEQKNTVAVFIMSQCPYGVRAVDAMKEVLANFKGKLNFDVHYIADENASKPTGFSALHGQPEVRENIRQLCAKKYYKKNNKYLDYLWCRNKNYRSEDWKGCAKDGIDAKVIEKCSTGDEGKKLHREDIKIAKTLGVSGSPTWLANNRYKFSGLAAEAIKGQICARNKDLPNCDKKLSAGKKVSGSCN